MSRPKLTDDVQHKIVSAIAMGAYDHVAARYAGVAPRQFYRWMKRGRAAPDLEELRKCSRKELKEIAQDEDVELNGHRTRPEIAHQIFIHGDRYRRFADAVERAQAEAEVAAVACLRRAWEQDWRSALEYLKRKHPERWSQTDQVLLRGQIEHMHSRGENPYDDDQPQTLSALGLSAEAVEMLGRSLAQLQSGRPALTLEAEPVATSTKRRKENGE